MMKDPVKVYVKDGDDTEEILRKACVSARETGLPINVVHSGVFSQLIQPWATESGVIDLYRKFVK